MLRAEWCKYRLDFKFLAKTSRESMLYKDTYFVRLYDESSPEICGIGECGLFRGLSADDVADYEDILSSVCRNPQGKLPPMSSIVMGFETAARDLAGGGRRVIYASDWLDGSRGIEINGLIWMGDKRLMLERVREKIEAGFTVLKLKIGGIDFDEELDILAHIRRQFSPSDLTIRLDANGSFSVGNALDRLDRLSRYAIHSIEQPIKAGQIADMARICRRSPIDIALDEELIGVTPDDRKLALLSEIRPRYIILKPTLCGGFAEADKWISAAGGLGIGWWATSALESNIGLNAIAQWLAAKDSALPQGLGTGALYHNNIPSPIEQCGSQLFYNPAKCWQMPDLPWRQ